MPSAAHGEFVWHEHLTKDPKAAIAFYSEVIGWRTQPFGEDERYLMWVGRQGPLGGVMALPDEVARMGVPPHWIGHVLVAEVDATVALARKLGGKVHREAADIPTVGRFAVIADPQGAALSVFTPSTAMALHDLSEEGEFCWNELVTSDSAAAFSFYAELFGWRSLQELDMGALGTYRIFGVGAQQRGGMMTTPPGAPMPPMWLFYAATSDLEATVARAKARGAQLITGPMDVPGGGRIANLIDPQGAAFALHQAPQP